METHGLRGIVSTSKVAVQKYELSIFNITSNYILSNQAPKALGLSISNHDADDMSIVAILYEPVLKSEIIDASRPCRLFVIKSIPGSLYLIEEGSGIYLSHAYNNL